MILILMSKELREAEQRDALMLSIGASLKRENKGEPHT